MSNVKSSAGVMLSNRRSILRAFKRFYQFEIFVNPLDQPHFKIYEKTRKSKDVSAILTLLNKSIVF